MEAMSTVLLAFIPKDLAGAFLSIFIQCLIPNPFFQLVCETSWGRRMFGRTDQRKCHRRMNRGQRSKRRHIRNTALIYFSAFLSSLQLLIYICFWIIYRVFMYVYDPYLIFLEQPINCFQGWFNCKRPNSFQLSAIFRHETKMYCL